MEELHDVASAMRALEARVVCLAAAEMEDISAPCKTSLELAIESLPSSVTGMTVLLLTILGVPSAPTLLALEATDNVPLGILAAGRCSLATTKGSRSNDPGALVGGG